MKKIALIVLLSCCAQPLAAQVIVPDTVAVADSTERFPAGKAMLRSMLVPGWGQFSVGAWKRGAFWVAVQGSSYYMLFKTKNKLDRAEDRLNGRIDMVRDSLLALDDTVDLELRLDTMSRFAVGRGLVSSRERHLQDWITYTIFFTLASGVDAFVAAHLADFPARIETQRQPDGATQFKVSVPFPSRREH